MAKEREKAAWRLQRDAAAWTALLSELIETLDALNTSRRRLGPSVEPLLLSTLQGPARVAAYQEHEAANREAVDDAVLRWCQYGELGRVPPSAEFWIAARFEHAWWLLKLLSAPDPDGVLRYLPVQNGRLLTGLREWLLIQAWQHAGADRFFREQ